ncbi:MAG: zinc-dependent peptidase [Salibacteraceae bacterium]
MADDDAMAALLVLLIFLVFLYLIAKQIFYFLFEDHIIRYTLWKSRGKVSAFDRSAIVSILTKRVPYFTELSARGKEKFTNRVLNHYTEKEFVGKEGQVVSREVKTLISAGAAQLTFGLEYSFLKHFETYTVFPNHFQINENYPAMYGATFPKGSIWFSWKQVNRGYQDYEDGINLAIHEFAHALYIQHRKGIIWEANWLLDYENWMTRTLKILNESTQEERSFFRRNIVEIPTELFPVMVEEFFERPELFFENFPRIYTGLVRLLNQDPRRVRQDFKPQSAWSFNA